MHCNWNAFAWLKFSKWLHLKSHNFHITESGKPTVKPAQIDVFDYIKCVREYSYLKQMDREWVWKKKLLSKKKERKCWNPCRLPRAFVLKVVVNWHIIMVEFSDWCSGKDFQMTNTDMDVCFFLILSFAVCICVWLCVCVFAQLYDIANIWVLCVLTLFLHFLWLACLLDFSVFKHSRLDTYHTVTLKSLSFHVSHVSLCVNNRGCESHGLRFSCEWCRWIEQKQEINMVI